MYHPINKIQPSPIYTLKQGFTLIELLVVVLIIGILAAVALPQYQKAVEKSRMAEALSMSASLRKAIDLYILTNGRPLGQEFVGIDGTGAANLLDIDTETSLDCSAKQDYCYSNLFAYDAFCKSARYAPKSCLVRAYRFTSKNPFTSLYYLEWQRDDDTGEWTQYCYPNTSFICKSIK